ncbi:MAG: hypothetical protein AAF393_05465 [Pseudomonadota bacterium]
MLRRAVYGLLTCFLGLAHSAVAQSQTTGVVEPLTPFQDALVPGPAQLSEYVTAGFEADLDGFLLIGDWQHQGVITEVGTDRITFQTTDGKIGNYVYRLRQGHQLSVQVGQQIVIAHSQTFAAKVLTFQVAIEADGQVVLMGQRALLDTLPEDDKAVPVVLSPNGSLIDLSFRPIEAAAIQTNKSQHGESFEYPVEVRTQTTGTTIGEIGAKSAATISLYGRNVFIDIEKSAQFVPIPHHSGFAPGGYIIEFYVVPD